MCPALDLSVRGRHIGAMTYPFWKTKSLEEMDAAEWESLCDGCGKCCLVKIEDADTGEISYTDIGCRLLDGDTCRCRDYANRTLKVPECVRLTPETVTTLGWLPSTCGYRLVAEGRDLPWWHPLVSGDPDTVRQAGVSAAGRVAASEDDLTIEEIIERVAEWPQRWPRKARRRPGT